jgi:hypothetical protein
VPCFVSAPLHAPSCFDCRVGINAEYQRNQLDKALRSKGQRKDVLKKAKTALVDQVLCLCCVCACLFLESKARRLDAANWQRKRLALDWSYLHTQLKNVKAEFSHTGGLKEVLLSVTLRGCVRAMVHCVCVCTRARRSDLSHVCVCVCVCVYVCVCVCVCVFSHACARACALVTRVYCLYTRD